MADRTPSAPSNAAVANTITVMVIDDSAVVREVMRSFLGRQPDMTVVTAADPIFAMKKMKTAPPDVIILDLEMPRMNGITFLRRHMRAPHPAPVIVCSGHTGPGTRAAVEALSEGAVTIVAKPLTGIRDFLRNAAGNLAETVRDTATVRLRRIPSSASTAPVAARLVANTAVRKDRRSAASVVAVGASTGGTEAILALLKTLKTTCVPILVTQHMPSGFTLAFSEHLNRQCKIEVREAREGDVLADGVALVAPGDRHMTLKGKPGNFWVHLDDSPPVSRHRPSVNVLFDSVAHCAGARGLGIILTGMGDDGAQGLLAMKKAGARTIAQDEQSCVVFGMPKEAIACGAAENVVPLPQLAGWIPQGKTP